MKFSKKLVASILVMALVFSTLTGVSAAVVDATNTVPNKAKLKSLTDEFSMPIAAIEIAKMQAGIDKTLDFKKVNDRATIIRYKAANKKEHKKYSKMLFGKKTNKKVQYGGDWGLSQPLLTVTAIKKIKKGKYYVNGSVSIVTDEDNKRHECGIFKLFVHQKKSAKYKYLADKLALTTWKVAKVKISQIDGFKSAKKYNNIHAKFTYEKVSVSGVAGAKAINKALSNDCNKFFNSRMAQNFYNKVKTDDAKGIKDDYFYIAESKLKYNTNNILSIRVTTRGYGGKKESSNEYGLNYNVRTGKKIGIKSVCYGSTKSIKKQMYDAINKTKSLKKYKKKAKKIIKKTKLKKLNFYLKNDKVIICFKPYTLHNKKQTTYKRFYIYSKYF